MRITEALATRRPTISFEFFPPKNDAAAEELMQTIDAMRALGPAFVSITDGAGGSTRERTIGLAGRIKNELALDVMAHMTCMARTTDDLHAVARDLEAAGIENVLALRGDPPRGAAATLAPRSELAHASELAALLERDYAFCIGGACYPETHTEAVDATTDLAHLVAKVDAGASFLITQLFFQNDRYFAFVDRARAAGISVPIVPGIMPITNFEQIQRFTTMCGAEIPASLRAELERWAGDTNAIVDLGVAFAALQSADLLRRGAPGIHFYTLNKSPAVRAIVSALRAEAVLTAA